MNSWIAAARPKTLTASLVPVVIAAAWADFHGAFHAPTFIAALVGALAIQIATNFINDGADFLRGADTAERLGPVRMAQSGKISPQMLFVGAGICFLLAIAAGAYLIDRAGMPILWIGAFSILCAVLYTSGPFPLAYYGLGDLFVMIFFGFVAVCGAFYAQVLRITPEAPLVGLLVGAHAVCLIAINNIRDIPTDKKAGKRTFAVLIGEGATRAEIIFFSWLPFAGALLLAWYHASAWLLLPLLAIPLAWINTQKLFRINDRREYNNLLAAAAKLQLAYGALFSLAYWRA